MIGGTRQPLLCAEGNRGSTSTSRPKSKRFHTHTALLSTICSVFILFVLAVGFSDWRFRADDPSIAKTTAPRRFARYLEQQNSSSNNQDISDAAASGDYSAFRCDDIFSNTPSKDSGAPTKRCQYAITCEGEGILVPVMFCSNSVLSPMAWFLLISPIVLLSLTLLFRLLGSTAEEYFSPALEYFSFKLGLPPRFAGVSLLALGNGAADVSATMNAISSDVENGYLLSLGALTGAAMFITTVVSGSVILTNGGLKCRGALVRDILALAITVMVVALKLETGKVSQKTESLFIGIYVMFVAIVLVADVYHRAIMVPRLQQQADLTEHERQLEAERVATIRAGDALNSAASAVGTEPKAAGLSHSVGTSAADILLNDEDENTHVAAPLPKQDDKPSKALNAVLTALSNYNDEEDELEVDMMGATRQTGWGIGSDVEGKQARDRPVLLRGADGILAKHQHTRNINDENSGDVEFHSSPYHVMEDLDLVDRVCIESGSRGHSAHNWWGAWHDGKQELAVHFQEYWADIVDDEESTRLEKILLICEFPLTIGRKVPIALYGFVVAATWIDWIADKLVTLLGFLGIVLRIPNYIMGLTVLAWGNSMADLSANVTLARKGLANMAITACFAGPVFNILIGLGAGFGVLRSITKTDVNYVHLTPSITTGFVFCFVNCGLMLVSGLAVNRGSIPEGYGYLAMVLYSIYIAASFLLLIFS
ncbi:hypothetical protein THAOC_00351 [Thalassiosira oceanica]|uniref:Sodium/calcium exchanger membrane region domain-containing protein n=1 Tax=Thalassiosira oceanica TaxID=159749 RepID=K0TPB7_THAOC|nr:hypothetical protein THAOC_00351 [Thalassiosira oceanica]|eukprot:EJK77796.1 hypothetical protein THAOC_00351 [Thalassiosira oceanica]